MASDPYRRWAVIYDRVVEPMQSGVRRIALRVLPPVAGWSVLDVGCGTGTGLVPYVEAGCSATGVEVSPVMFDKAMARLGDRAGLHLTDGEALPFEDGAFDLVLTSMVLHEIPAEARPRFVSEMARVARPDGHLLFIDFRCGSLRGLKGFALRGLSTAIERVSGHYDGYRTFRAAGGVPHTIGELRLGVEREKAVAGGNLGIYVVSPRPAGDGPP